jgi:predicted enzyme related to lactoylglutathione lyase
MLKFGSPASEINMHKSRLGGFSIDCQDADLQSAGRFWSEALGQSAKPPRDRSDNYLTLGTAPDGLSVEVQRVDHPSRVHLDIETDDIPAEVKRLERLGAKVVSHVKTWVVMEAPTGQRFCVVPAQNPDFDATANRWE